MDTHLHAKVHQPTHVHSIQVTLYALRQVPIATATWEKLEVVIHGPIRILVRHRQLLQPLKLNAQAI
jgi:hypothetical protein